MKKTGTIDRPSDILTEEKWWSNREMRTKKALVPYAAYAEIILLDRRDERTLMN